MIQNSVFHRGRKFRTDFSHHLCYSGWLCPRQELVGSGRTESYQGNSEVCDMSWRSNWFALSFRRYAMYKNRSSLTSEVNWAMFPQSRDGVGLDVQRKWSSFFNNRQSACSLFWSQGNSHIYFNVFQFMLRGKHPPQVAECSSSTQTKVKHPPVLIFV